MRIRSIAFLVASAMVLHAACSINDKKAKDDDGGSSSQGGAGGATSSGSGMTEECEAMCIPQFPAGEALYRGLRGCLLCYACFEACIDANADTCTNGGVEGGCSVMATDCASCTASTCALEQLPDLNFAGLCANDGTACSQNVDCVRLNNCVSTCAMNPTTAPASSVASTGAAGGN